MAAERRVEHLLIGGGIACATAARTLREEGAVGSLLLATIGRRSPRDISRAVRPDPPL